MKEIMEVKNNMNTYGLTKKEYIALLKECGMCTKKWTLSKWKEFNKKRLDVIHSRKKKKKRRWV